MRICVLRVIALLCCGAVLADAAEEPKSAKVRIVLAGDSTVTDTAGWGQAFAALLKPGAECINLARGGQSSKSFYDKGNWKQALAKKPDYILIQFGHNDQPGKGPERETDPATTYRDYLRKYIDEAREAGAKPVLVTSMVRRIFTPEGKIESNLAPYAEAMQAVAAEKQVPVVDLHRRSLELVERLGPEKSRSFGPPHPTLAGQIDGTHLSAEGAQAMAPLVAAELWNVVPELRDYLPSPEKSGSTK